MTLPIVCAPAIRSSLAFRVAAAGVYAASLTAGVAAQTVRITGAGATFPYPIYSRWFAEYNKLRADVLINYQSIGSGGGIRQMKAGTVFFGATDGPMTTSQLESARGPIVHIPTVLGAVVPIYNVPGVHTTLRFTGSVLADIFLGRITKWNEMPIASINLGVPLPAIDIVVAHRADGSGATYIWADYLSKVSSEWKSTVGIGTSVAWRTGVGARGNEGVTGLVSQTPGAIGYVELIYALQTNVDHGAVQNVAGEFVEASVESVTAAAAAEASRMPDDFRISITNAAGKGVYPISSFSWLLLYVEPKDKAQARAMIGFLRWALTEGQRFCAGLGYAPLPEAIVRLEIVALARIRTS